jgi:phospholipid:diacylglycerol acyltransferase
VLRSAAKMGLTMLQHPAGSWVLEKVGDSSEATPRAQLIDQFFSRKERAKLFRRWPGASSMWIKVGQNRLYPCS